MSKFLSSLWRSKWWWWRCKLISSVSGLENSKFLTESSCCFKLNVSNIKASHSFWRETMRLGKDVDEVVFGGMIFVAIIDLFSWFECIASERIKSENGKEMERKKIFQHFSQSKRMFYNTMLKQTFCLMQSRETLFSFCII